MRDTWDGFEVVQTTKLSQTAVMVLSPGESSSVEMNSHEKSDQILLVMEGELLAEVGKEKKLIRSGEFCTVTAGTLHRFTNQTERRAVTFNVYTPPEY